MKCQTLLSVKTKENIINLSSANFAKRVIKVVFLQVLSKAVLC